jgi:hypothetical protein
MNFFGTICCSIPGLYRNLFLKPNSIPIPSPRLFESVPMNPQEGAPILPQQFR